MGRPAADIDVEKLVELHSRGYPDRDIAKVLNTSRPTVLRKRRELGLEPNRDVGVRGIAIKDDDVYWLLVRRSMQYIGSYMLRAAREYYQTTGDWDRYFIVMVMEPRPMFHPFPGPYASDPDRMNYKNTKYITDFEQLIDHVGLAGVPGLAVLDLIRIYKNGDIKYCMKLAREAVENAGFIRADAKVGEIEKCISPEEYHEYWEEQELMAMDWTPVKDWGQVGRESFRVYNDYSDGNGKRGKTGSIHDVSITQAYLAAAGY